MGSPEDERGRDNDERQHPVTLTRGFWLAETACTQAQWKAVMGDNPSRFQNEPKSAQHPVEIVSWNDVAKFIKRLNRAVPGLEARLPTEAEWEYACRAGTATAFSFGDSITPEQVNYKGGRRNAGGAKGEYRQRTVPVKSLAPNSWGLHEMHGNVWEWCSDWSDG
jgi:formylglycine-generating enzyme required for sulfatase activity